jgi:hypothetical protein
LQLPPVDVVFACLRMVDGSYMPRFLHVNNGTLKS